MEQKPHWFWKMATPAIPSQKIVKAGLGGLIAIGIIALLASLTNEPLILGSFGASCVLVFGYPESPFSRARQVIGGHVIGAFSGLLILHLLGHSPFAFAIAMGLAIVLMMITRSVHPPAGSNPVIVMMSQPGWMFLIKPVLIGSICLAIIGWLYHRITSKVAP
ncbi:HPP family protein [Leeia sp. TBRC 13508]|uniref:HPP family protein n=1 Tax=Leeia speluncae TaxID=2884804 RepID=A0ABS8DB01_9NEIS|nr:HPP family protein [Leeia speluncae]MCB6185399.1 HPP family protein [Leeia speluncae]